MPNTIDDYALLTPDEAKDCLELPDTFDQFDTLIQFINGISELAERYCARLFLSRAMTETFDGNGANYHILENGQDTTAISAVCYRNYGETDYNETADAVAADSIKYNPNTGEVYLLDNYAFERGFQNCFITHTSGKTAVPDSIKLACKMILKDFWKQDDKQTAAVASMTVEGQTINFVNEDIPIRARKILDRWRRPRMA